MNAKERIKRFRSEIDLTTRALGEVLGVSASVISDWESGKAPVRKPNAMALQLLYGVSWKWLMEGEGPMWVQTSSSEALPPAPEPPRAPAVRHLVAAHLAAAQCQAAGVAADPDALVASYRDLLLRLGADKPARG